MHIQMFAAVVLLVGAGLTVGHLVAQTHPCDQPAPTSVTVGNSGTHKPQFCAKPSDGIEAYVVYINGTVAVDLRPLTLVVGPNTAGFALYEGVRELQFQSGSYTVEIAVYNKQFTGGPTQLSAKSSPLSLAAVSDNPLPAAPKIMGIIR